jgi:tetratricopeptide (TPR) repeat protein
MQFLSTFSLQAIAAIALLSTASVATASQTVESRLPPVCETGWPLDASIWNNYRLYERAVQSAEDERFADAARLFDCLNRIPDTRLFYTAAIAHLRAGNLQAAEANFRNELSLRPRSARAQLGLGFVYVQQGRRHEAEKMLRTLEQRQKRCGSRCARAAEIERATEVLARALG